MTTQQRTIYLVPARVAPRPVVAPRMPVQRTAPAPMHHQPAIRRVHHAPPVQKPTLKRPLVESPSPEDPLEALLNEGTGMGLPRKREKLNHLTVEEKMDRRKLKNRVAAQTARDRKKVRSQRMEDVLRQLMEENQRLREENSRLKAEKQQQKEVAFEPAAFISGPLPRVQAASLLPLICLLTTLFRKTSSNVSSKKSRRSLTSTSSPVSSRVVSRSPMKRRRSLWRDPLSRRPRLWDAP